MCLIFCTEYGFHLVVEFCNFTTLILQLHLDVALELVKLCEYRYHGDLKNPACQSQSIKLHLDIPFSSGQILLKYCKSRYGRSLSIGMQYLKNNPCEFMTVDTQKNKPYCVQSILQPPLPRLLTDKILHNPQLLLTTGLKSARVVENITFMVCEDMLVLDVVLATLQAGSSRSAITNKNGHAQPPSWVRVEPR